MADNSSLTLRLRSDLREIGRLHDAMDGFAGVHDLPPPLVFQLNLCLEEVVTNVIRHAYPTGSGQVVDVSIHVDPSAITMRIDDDGPPFDPLARPPVDTTLPLEAREPGGLGVHFVRQLMTDVEYRREGNRNVLILRKSLSQN